MLILARYLLRHCLSASLMSLVVFLGVVGALFLAELMRDAAQGELPGASVMLMLALRLPEALMLVGPLALLTGLLLALGRLQEDSELIVIRSSGLSFGRVLAPVMLLAALWAGLLLAVSGWLSPLAVERSSEILAEAARSAIQAGLRAGQFDHLNQGRTTVYVSRIDREAETFHDVFIQHQEQGFVELLTAREGRLWLDEEQTGPYLLLREGHQVQHASNPAAGPLREMRFARNELRLPPPEPDMSDSEATARLPELWSSGAPEERREWHWRLAAPVAAFLLGLLALPLAGRQPRQGRHGSVVTALVIYLFYSNAVHAGLILMEQHNRLAGPGLWPVHLALGVLVLFLLQRMEKNW